MHRAEGYDVTAEYYVDDMGKQVGILCWALENLDESQVLALLAEGDIPIEESPHSSKDDHARVLWYQAANILSVLQGKDLQEDLTD